MDKSTIGGIVIALGFISAALMMEGGSLLQVMQPTALMIVLGGTVGAVMIQFPLPVVMKAAKKISAVFIEPKHDLKAVVDELVKYANQARKEGIVSLDKELANIHEPFMKKALMLAVDGTEPAELRGMMEVELDQRGDQDEKIPQVFEAAGGYAPTVGIIGAVLGLIQVMQHLDNIEEVGRGIAVAFVATIYGVGFSNLFFLPAAGKLKIRLHHEHLAHEMTLDGVVSILEGMNPRMLETKLLGYLADAPPPAQQSEEAKAASA